MRARGVGGTLALVSVVLATGLAGGASVGAPLMAAAAGEGMSAVERAALTGEPVEVESERAEYAEAYALPDGRVRMDLTVSPVWARGEDGQWHRPDATLEAKADGTIGPRYDVAGTRFSGGGAGPMARMSREGSQVTFAWPDGPLPAPTISGTRATYAEVWPGVDLVLDAAADGFRPLLMVKTPEAARLPRLASVSFPVSTAGVTLRSDGADGFEFVDRAGSVVFSGPAGAMWDSAGDSRIKLTGVPGEADVPGRRASAGGDRTKRVPVAASPTALTMMADSAWLTSSDRVFPVFVDPVTGAGTPTYTMVSSGGWQSWKFSGDEGVGKCGSWNGYYCGDGFVKRIFFQFSKAQADALVGKDVMDATFRAYETWSFQCSDRWINLYKNSGTISSSTAWPGPTAVDLLGDRYVSAGRADLCSPSQPDAWIDFNDNPDETDENLTPTVKSWVAGDYDLTLRLSAADETDTSAFKRFQGSNASLQVYYRPVPITPTPFGVKLGVMTTAPCSTAANPTIVDTTSATFTGTVQSQKDGDPAPSLKLKIGYSEDLGNGSWGTENVQASATSVKDNTVQSISNMAVKSGSFYRARAWTTSQYSSETPLTSSPTGYCYFLTDTTAPVAPTITAGSPYVLCGSGECAASGSAGTPGTFTATNGEKYLATAEWWLYDDLNPSPVAAGTASATTGAASITVTPQTPGFHYLHVRLVDRFNRPSLETVVSFKVGL